MPRLSESEFNSLMAQLRWYSPEGMQSVIDAARDPEAALQMTEQLANPALYEDSGDFTAAGLCIALGETRTEGAVPALLRTATRMDVDTDWAPEAAVYALQRMGQRAFDAAMAFIESESDLCERSAAYEVLDAAVDAEGAIRDRVADFCLRRAPAEIAAECEECSPGEACCTVLLMLRDMRVKPLLQQAAEGLRNHICYQSLLDDLNTNSDPDVEFSWRQPWQEICAEWTGFGNEEWSEEQAERKRDEFDKLADEFAASEYAKGLPRDAEWAAGSVAQALNMGVDYVEGGFSVSDVGAMSEVLYEWLPRKVSAEQDYFTGFPYVLEAFARFLNATGRLPDPNPLIALAREARTELPRLAADPDNWGMAKSMVMRGHAAGFDMSSQEGMAGWMAAYNASLQAARAPQQAAADPRPNVPQPIRRESPKIGRNDPCPCGSGKKYKKCCGGGT